mgnify:CR=1 FL=1
MFIYRTLQPQTALLWLVGEIVLPFVFALFLAYLLNPRILKTTVTNTQRFWWFINFKIELI